MDNCGLCGEPLGNTFHTCTPKIVKVYSEEQYESLRAELELSRWSAANIEHNRKLNQEEKLQALRERDEALRAELAQETEYKLRARDRSEQYERERDEAVRHLGEEIAGLEFEVGRLEQANAALLGRVKLLENYLEELREKTPYGLYQEQITNVLNETRSLAQYDTAQPTAPINDARSRGDGCDICIDGYIERPDIGGRLICDCKLTTQGEG